MKCDLKIRAQLDIHKLGLDPKESLATHTRACAYIDLCSLVTALPAPETQARPSPKAERNEQTHQKGGKQTQRSHAKELHWEPYKTEKEIIHICFIN